MKRIGLSLCLAACLAMPAGAAVVSDGSGTPQGTGSVDLVSAVATFDWTATPVTVFLDFTATNEFSLFLLDYSHNDTADQITGYVLDRLDGPGGTAVTRLANDTTFCGSSVAPVQGDCNVMARSDTSGTGNAAFAATPSAVDPVLSGLAAGSYRLGIFDSATPVAGTARFGVSEVPLPAPAALLLAGLALLVAGRRRG